MRAEVELLDFVPQNLIAGITLRTTTTDLTTYAQAAATALFAEYGGGILRYPAGLVIHGPVYVPNSNVHIAGRGKFATKVKLKDSPLADQFSLFAFGIQSDKTTIVAVENVGVSDMEIDGNKANQLRGTAAENGINAGIGTWRTKRLTLKNLVVHDCDGYGLGLVGTDVADRSDFSIEDVECYANIYDGIDIKGGTTNKPMRLHMSRVYSHDNGPSLISGRDAVGIDLRGQWVRLEDCHAWSNNLVGIRCRDVHLFELVARGCTANSNGTDGFQVLGATSPLAFKFYGCYANDNTESGWDVRTGPTSLFDCYATGNDVHGVFQQTAASILNIVGGRFTGNADDGVASLVAGAVLNISGGAVVDLNNRHGVNFRGSRLIAEGVIGKNNGQTTAGRGIVVDGTNTITYWSITGCQLYDDQGVKTQTHGVQFASAPPAGVLFGNDLAGNLTGEITGTVPAGTLRQAAATDFSGLVELATDAEAIAKADTARAMTPSNLAALGGSTTFAGLLELATDAETITGTDTARPVTPSNLTAAGVYRSGGTDVAVADGGTGASTARAAAANLLTWYALGYSSVAVSHTGDTTETTRATITIPAGAIGANGRVRITTLWSYTNSVNNKNMRVRFNGLAGTVYANYQTTTTATIRAQAEIANVNATNSQKGSNTAGTGGWHTSTGAVVTSAVDTTAAVDIVLTAQLTDSGETITLESYIVELLSSA